MRRLVAPVLAAVAAAFIAPAPALATDWVATVGLRLRIKPPYEGSDNHVIAPIPSIVLRRADRPYRFIPPDGAAALAIIDTAHVVAGPVLRFRGSRPDTGRFAGLERVPVATEVGGFVDVWPVDWLRLRVEGRQGFGGHHGIVGDAGADLVKSTPKWDLSLGPRFGWGDASYMDTYFGITPAEAVLRRSRTYEPGSGARYVGAVLAGAYHLDKRWTVNADVGYNRLSEKARASPVVRTVGAGNQWSLGLGANYRFGLKL